MGGKVGVGDDAFLQVDEDEGGGFGVDREGHGAGS